jgi:hypothetical protein
MTIKNVYWKQSNTKQILGNLIIDGENVVFTKDETDYANGGVRIMRKDKLAQEKATGFMSKLFKKATSAREDFGFVKSELQGLSVSTQKFPKQDPKTYRAIPGVFSYAVSIKFTADGAAYELSITGQEEGYAAEVEGLLK